MFCCLSTVKLIYPLVLCAAFCRISSAQEVSWLSGRLVAEGGSAGLRGLRVRIDTLADLSSDQAAHPRVSPLLRASPDVFQRAVSYHLSPYGFVPRGYGLRFSRVLLNGVSMNDLYSGRPNWRDWGGLNDVTRHPQELRYALQPSDYTFSGVGRLTAIDTRAADYRPQLRFSFSLANRSYRQRLMVTYASGLMRKGWALLFSASHRWAREGRIQGTSYDAWAYFLGVEKRFAPHHSLSFSTLGAPIRWADHSPNTRAVYDLKGGRYNAYWGWQDGKKRNERMRHRYAPLFQLSFYWTPSEDLQWENTLSYQFGREGQRRLQTYQAPNPTPTYYRKLPNYFRSLKRFRTSADVRRHFLRDSTYAQIDWPTLYRRNRHNLRTITDPDGSRHFLYGASGGLLPGGRPTRHRVLRLEFPFLLPDGRAL